MAKIRIDKMLSNMGYGSRSEIKRFAKSGLIRLNEKTQKDVSQIIDTESDTLFFDDKIVQYREHIHLLMNKPQGVVSATFDNVHQTVIDILPEEYQIYKPFPVGRLDIDTEGLLLITNDGKFSHDLLSPKKHIDKTYYVEVDGALLEKDIQAFIAGIALDDGYHTMPAILNILSSSSERSFCTVVIQEGKFHQVKRMFAEIGRKVLFLKRVKIGNLELDNSLGKGEVRELSPEEIDLLFSKN